MIALVTFCGQPGAVPVGQDSIQNHQALDHSAQGDRLAVPVIGLANRLVHRLVVDVEQAPLMESSGRDRGGEPAGGELGHEVVALLAVRDAREGAVLAFEEYPECTITVTRNRAWRSMKPNSDTAVTRAGRTLSSTPPAW